MNDSIIVFERIDAATLASSAGTDAAYPLTNLKDGRYGTQWKSGGTTDNQILTSTESKTTNSFLIAHHNLATLGLTSLYVFGTGFDPIAVITSFPDPLYAEFTSLALSDIKFQFVKGSALSAAPQIGMIFTGRKASLPLYLNNPKRGLKADIITDEALSGLRYKTTTKADRQTWKLDYGALKLIDHSEVFRWMRGIGVGLHPFWFRDMDDNWHFVSYDADAAESGSKGNLIFDMRNIQLSEERVGIPMVLPGGYTV